MTTKVLFDVVSMFNEIVLIGIASFLELLMGLSVVLFILDGIKAKSQNRKRKVGITTAFIITIIIHVLACLFIIFFFAVIFMAARGIPSPFTWPWFK